jgi:hypothetical protein
MVEEANCLSTIKAAISFEWALILVFICFRMNEPECNFHTFTWRIRYFFDEELRLSDVPKKTCGGTFLTRSSDCQTSPKKNLRRCTFNHQLTRGRWSNEGASLGNFSKVNPYYSLLGLSSGTFFPKSSDDQMTTRPLGAPSILSLLLAGLPLFFFMHLAWALWF